MARRFGWRVKQDHFSYSGKYYRVDDMCSSQACFEAAANALRGRRVSAAKELIAEKCDAYLMHGDPPERVGEKFVDLRERRARHNLPPLKSGRGYAVVRETEREAQDELRRITDVSNPGGYANYQQWLPEHNWSSAFPWKIIRFRTRPAVWARRHAGTGGRTTYPIRSRRC